LWLKLPVLFDISTLVLLAGGCLLLWRNLGARREEVLPPISNPEAEESVVPRAELLVTKEASELCANNETGLLNAAAAQEPAALAEALPMDQNHYASSVSAAIAKFRKPPAIA
jgi:hypothetical protein